MKKLILIITVLAVAFTGCQDETKNLNEKHQVLLKESDSILQSYSQLYNEHSEMLETHRNLSTQVESSGMLDAGITERLSGHEVVMQRHEAQLENHKMMLENHMEFKDGFEDLSLVEMEAQIERMRVGHDRILSEQETMEQEHEMMHKEHQEMLQKLAEFQTD